MSRILQGPIQPPAVNGMSEPCGEIPKTQTEALEDLYPYLLNLFHQRLDLLLLRYDEEFEFCKLVNTV
jgi:hypothetical protein